MIKSGLLTATTYNEDIKKTDFHVNGRSNGYDRI